MIVIVLDLISLSLSSVERWHFTLVLNSMAMVHELVWLNYLLRKVNQVVKSTCVYNLILIMLHLFIWETWLVFLLLDSSWWLDSCFSPTKLVLRDICWVGSNLGKVFLKELLLWIIILVQNVLIRMPQRATWFRAAGIYILIQVYWGSWVSHWMAKHREPWWDIDNTLSTAVYTRLRELVDSLIESN